MDELNIIKFKMLLKEFDECKLKDIEYDWDAGHCYSSIKDCPSYTKLHEEHEEHYDEIEDHCNEWLYNHDECPPCEIHVKKDGQVSSGCGCHDGICEEERSDVLHRLTIIQEETNNQYLITMEE